ncbi:unnamed protein product [Rotaria sp. Silwood2]|nr:unnamed protein product [Rotaria sp. Silwood2]
MDTNTTFTKDDYDLSIIKGFQLATANGFLCADPVEGVAFVIERSTINKIVNNENNDEQQETSGINNTDSATITTTINPVDEIESLIETMGITTEESSTLYIQQKPRLVIDKSKVVIKHESFSDQIISTIREACRIAYYNRVPFVEIDDPNNPKVDFNRSKIRYTTIFTNALSTCRGFLITGNIGEQPFVYLAHRSKTYELPSFTPSSTLIELIEDLTDDIEMKIFNNPPPNTKEKLTIYDLTSLNLLVCGSVTAEIDLISDAFHLLKDKNTNIQNLLKDQPQCLYFCQQLKNLIIIPPVIFLVSGANSDKQSSDDPRGNTGESLKNEPSVCLSYSCDSQVVHMQIEWVGTTSQFDIAHLSIDYKTIEENDFSWKLQIDSIDKAQEELKNPKDLEDFNDALNYVLSVINPPPIPQHHATVLITTKEAHPWTIMGFNELNGNVNAIFTFKCDSLIASHGLLIYRNHIFAAALDHPSIYVWNLNSRDQDYKKLTVAGPISSMTFIGDSSVLACAIGNKIFLYRLDNGRYLITLSGHIRTINNLLFHEDENYLISAGEDTFIHRWNIEEIPVNIDQNINFAPTKSFQGHTGPIHDLCQILIGRFHLLLTGSSDFRTCLCTFLFPNEIHSICVSSFSKTIYCGTDIGTIFIVPLRRLLTQFGEFQH